MPKRVRRDQRVHCGHRVTVTLTSSREPPPGQCGLLVKGENPATEAISKRFKPDGESGFPGTVREAIDTLFELSDYQRRQVHPILRNGPNPLKHRRQRLRTHRLGDHTRIKKNHRTTPRPGSSERVVSRTTRGAASRKEARSSRGETTRSYSAAETITTADSPCRVTRCGRSALYQPAP